jgi:hypothetical protein
MFNLVFVSNTSSVKLWRKLNFKELAVLPRAAALKGQTDLVDAIQFHYDFSGAVEDLKR